MAAADALIEVYRRAYLEILQRIAEKRSRGRSTAFDEALMRDVGGILSELDATAEQWAWEVIPKVYGEGVREALAPFAAMRGGKALQIAPGMIKAHQHAVQILIDSLLDDLHDAHTFVGRRIRDQWRSAQLEAVLEKTATGQTMRQAQKALRESLADEGLTAFRDSRGREWGLDSYANMVVRSVTAESQNAGLLMQLDGMGHDLVRMTEHRATCPICSQYEGRVYSRTGKTQGYPVLTDVPGFSEGYESIHPNCVHRLTPYVPEGDDNVEGTKKFSNRPFEDTRSAADKEAYERQQEMGRLRRDRRKLEQQLAILPAGVERDAIREKLREVRGEQQRMGRQEKQARLRMAAENRAYYAARDSGQAVSWPGRQ
jgi:hypothetical protein